MASITSNLDSVIRSVWGTCATHSRSGHPESTGVAWGLDVIDTSGLLNPGNRPLVGQLDTQGNPLAPLKPATIRACKIRLGLSRREDPCRDWPDAFPAGTDGAISYHEELYSDCLWQDSAGQAEGRMGLAKGKQERSRRRKRRFFDLNATARASLDVVIPLGLDKNVKKAGGN